MFDTIADIRDQIMENVFAVVVVNDRPKLLELIVGGFRLWPKYRTEIAAKTFEPSEARYRTNKRPVDSRCLSGAFTDFSQKDPMSTQTALT